MYLSFLLTIVLGVQPLGRVAVQSGGGIASASCGAETVQARRIVTYLTTATEAADARASVNMPKGTTANIRLMADATAGDATMCQNMRNFVQWQSSNQGGNLTGTTLVFYQIGATYVAVVSPSEPPPAAPRPGYAHVRTGWTGVYVFDQNGSWQTTLAL